MIIIAGYLVFFGAVMYQNPSNYEGWQTLNATYGVIVATVVGYYFGHKNVREANERAKQTKVRAINMVGENVAEMDKGEDEYNRLINSLENIKREYGID